MSARERAAYVGIALACLGVILVGLSGILKSTESQAEPRGRVCLSAEVWSADDSERPCAQIVKVWEDGSTRVRITQADGDVLWITTTGSRW